MATVDPSNVERALTAYYLQTDGPAGAGPVRYLDASRESLSIALRGVCESDPLKCLAASCGGAHRTSAVYAGGFSQDWADQSSPGYLRYLVLSCAVIAQLEPGGNNFRIKLSDLFQEWGPSLFQNRDALPDLWARLAAWCKLRAQAGNPIRTFDVPARRGGYGNVKQLRISYELSFPSWRDLARLQHLIERNSDLRRVRDAYDAARTVAPAVLRDGFSHAMDLAAREFLRLYEAKASLLHLHRFWGALSHVLSDASVPERGGMAVPHLLLTFGLHVEDAGIALIERDDSGRELTVLEREEGPVEEMMGRLHGLLSTRAYGRRGRQASEILNGEAIPFVEEGYATWSSQYRRPIASSRCLLLVSNSRSDLQALGPLQARLSENWSLIGPLSEYAAKRAFTALALPEVESARERMILFLGGIATPQGFLGPSSLLPRVAIPPTARLEVAHSSPTGAPVAVVHMSPGVYQLQSANALDGAYSVRVTDAPVDGLDALVLERTIRFAAEAPEHPSLGSWNHARSTLLLEMRVEEATTTRISFVSADARETGVRRATDGSEANGSWNDLLEAIYAGGRSGWSESGLIELVQSQFGHSFSPWDLLRSLEESGWLCSTLDLSWRARRWWLRPPTLLTVANGEREFALLQGSICAALRRRFVSTVEALGGRIELGRRPSDFANPPLYALGLDLANLRAELRWSEGVLLAPSSAPAPACWEYENVDPVRHKATSWWSWELGRFTRTETAEGDVRLRRYVRDAADRSDIYVVDGVGLTAYRTVSRASAIVEAYRRSGRPLFKIQDGWLLRLAREGHLPLPLARAAGVTAASASGLVKMDGQWIYAYAANGRVLRTITEAFGSALISGETEALEDPLSSSSLGLRRNRARGRH